MLIMATMLLLLLLFLIMTIIMTMTIIMIMMALLSASLEKKFAAPLPLPGEVYLVVFFDLSSFSSDVHRLPRDFRTGGRSRRRQSLSGRVQRIAF